MIGRERVGGDAADMILEASGQDLIDEVMEGAHPRQGGAELMGAA